MSVRLEGIDGDEGLHDGGPRNVRPDRSGKNPRQLEALGRRVTPFNDDLWKRHLKDTSHEIVRQKFKNDDIFRCTLLSTEGALILNAEQDDLIWGAGISVNDVFVHGISVWDGTNLLGKALMHVRDTPHWVEDKLMEAQPL